MFEQGNPAGPDDRYINRIILSYCRAVKARDRMRAARREVQEAEQKIAGLAAALHHMRKLVREDPLTGSRKRRGLDTVFARETARADRHSTPLCLVMLDPGDFKRRNDTYGHQAGDAASSTWCASSRAPGVRWT